MSGVVDNTRPPYVAFERRPVEDRTASQVKGHYASKDVDFAIITRPGSRDTLEEEVVVWLEKLRQRAKAQQIPANWYEGFSAAYKAWKEGEEIPTEGTPIKGWPVLSPAAQKELAHVGIRTVEDLAQMPENELSVLGTGALSMKQKAVAWLQAAEGSGKIAEQLSAMAVKINDLTTLVQNQAAELDKYRREEAAKVPQKA
jgi:hypothetical protein